MTYSKKILIAFFNKQTYSIKLKNFPALLKIKHLHETIASKNDLINSLQNKN